MNMPKSPVQLMEFFAEVVPAESDVSQKKVFGYPAAFVNDNMFMGLHGDQMILRLGPEDRETLLKVEGAHVFEPMEGRPMKEYVVVPLALRECGSDLRPWIDRALAFGRSLPPKVKKPKMKDTATANIRKEAG